MKKTAFTAILLSLLLVFGIAGCSKTPGGTTDQTGGGKEDGAGSSQEEPAPPAPTGKNVFEDELYSCGFTLRGTGVNGHDRELAETYAFKDGVTPKWGLAQWYSRYALEEGERSVTNAEFKIRDKSKEVRLDRTTGELTLSLNAAEEYDGVQAPGAVTWPHLLLEQSPTPVSFKDCATMRAQLTFTINRAVDRASSFGEVPICLQAQFAWFIYIRNVDPESEGFGEFLWFGFNLYDPTRYYAPGTAMQDYAGGNPGEYIYTLGASESIGKTAVKVGQKVSLDVDLFPAVQKALETAHKAGFMTGSELEDCAVTGMNIGFEVFDVWDISATIHKMRVDYTEKE